MKTNKSPPIRNIKYANQVSTDSVKQEERHLLIQKEAYLIAISRGFDKKDALNDWLTAEMRIDSSSHPNTHSSIP